MTRPALALLLLGSCGPWMTDGDFHWVHRAGADMPVFVRGNVDSGRFLVTVHGGPGHNGLGMGLSRGMRMLEEEMAVVYWDQRASGMSQGNPSPDTFTVADFVADTDAVLSVIQEAYDVEALYVYGHSWGGDLALATQLDGRQADAVDAWIISGGSPDEAFSLSESRAWMLDTIEQYLADGIDTEFWSEVADWYDANPVLLPSDPRHFSYVSRTRGYYYNIEAYEPPPVGELAFASPFSLSLYQNEKRSQRLCVALLDGFDVSDRLSEVSAPTLVIGGELDGAVPPSSAELIYDLLGTDPREKQLAIVPGVAHSPRDEDSEAFVALVSAFLEEHTP